MFIRYGEYGDYLVVGAWMALSGAAYDLRPLGSNPRGLAPAGFQVLRRFLRVFASGSIPLHGAGFVPCPV